LDKRLPFIHITHIIALYIIPEHGAFAAVLKDGTVVTWGHKNRGGDSSTVHEVLRGVEIIYSTSVAFAAVLKDGTVVTWGQKNGGGDSSTVQEALRGVEIIYSTSEAFAAVLKDGTVVTWGNEDYGGDSSAVQEALRGVVRIYSTSRAFAAVLKDFASEEDWKDSGAILTENELIVKQPTKKR